MTPQPTRAFDRSTFFLSPQVSWSLFLWWFVFSFFLSWTGFLWVLATSALMWLVSKSAAGGMHLVEVTLDRLGTCKGMFSLATGRKDKDE